MRMELPMNRNDLKKVYEEFTKANVYARDPLHQQHHRALTLITALNNNIRYLRNRNEELESKYEVACVKANHWDILKKAIEENPMLKEEWDRFCMLLKLATEK
jgi:hypothetical protein